MKIGNFFRHLLSVFRGEPQNLGKLITKGLVVGKGFNRMSGVIIDPSHCYHIRIGDNVTLAPRVHVLAHDSSTFTYLGKTRAANVRIGNDVFIGASSIILPGVSIGNCVVIGAGSVVTKDIPDNSVAVGNPARVVCSLDDYLNKIRGNMCESNTFVGLDPNNNLEECRVAVECADRYGEIYVS